MIKKKEHPVFKVPNFGAKSRKRVKARWRRQRGIDNKMREHQRGHGASPSIGYKNPDAIRHTRSDGSREVLVHNTAELEALAGMAGHVARLASRISRRKKLGMQEFADSRKIRIVNRVGA
jgi:large subunit ribosomal protein L32e